MSTGPITPQFTEELEELKWWLAGLQGDELTSGQASAIGAEISAIRLHLKRLALEREALEERTAGLPEPGA